MVTQKWGSKQLHFQQATVDRIVSSKSILIQFEHYGGKRYYKFNLSEIPC
tara:strand:- start:173 stop:322 length:150 start_codon:yes stop_codon:yes gene_type:complete